MVYYVGIDGGKTGGFAVISPSGELVVFERFTNWKTVKRKLFSYRREIKHCAIEKAASKSGQGSKSIFTFGANYGGWLCYLEMGNIPHAIIPPQRWQKMFLGSFPKGESKIRSVEFINRRYPHANLKKSDHGVSDAICLALYALVLDKRMSNKT